MEAGRLGTELMYKFNMQVLKPVQCYTLVILCDPQSWAVQYNYNLHQFTNRLSF